MEAPLDGLKAELARLLSLENLETDPCTVLTMENDLWIPLNYLCNIECLKLFHPTPSQIVHVGFLIGCEYDSKFNRLRKRIYLERKQITVSGFSKPDELKAILKDFDYINIQSDGKVLYVNCYTEEDTVAITRFLINSGIYALIDYIDTFTHLLICAHRNIHSKRRIPFFSTGNEQWSYSIEELKRIYQRSTFEKPHDFENRQWSYIRNTPRPIAILEKQ